LTTIGITQDSDGLIHFTSVTVRDSVSDAGVTLCPNVSLTLRELLTLADMEGVIIETGGGNRF